MTLLNLLVKIWHKIKTHPGMTLAAGTFMLAGILTGTFSVKVADGPTPVPSSAPPTHITPSPTHAPPTTVPTTTLPQSIPPTPPPHTDPPTDTPTTPSGDDGGDSTPGTS